ncbi:hypothetical protein LQR31_15915 [Chromobacterium vaccinii]|uniref:hypothetical protein n=1 Tax=Chromobacterium vaccinii TaxID=1108595 RepID=UPI001E5188A8|nr:hypothetical protein [Chromobacterium vaccinii]MCD4485959.1 hypothetical protein [Chromobacterium vaccinii]
MTIDGLLTFLTLLVAVYALTSRAQRLNLLLKIRIWHWLISLLLLAIVHILEFPMIFAISPALQSIIIKIKNPKEVAYLVLLTGVVFIGFSIHLSPLPRNRAQRLNQLIATLTTNGETAEVLALLQTHFNRLVRIYRGDFFAPRLRTWLVSGNRFSRGPDLEHLAEKLRRRGRSESLRPLKHNIADRMRKKIGNSSRYLGNLLPSNEMEKNAVSTMLRSNLLHPQILQAIIKSQPYFGLRVLSEDTQVRFEFCDEFLRALLIDTSSILYLEIKNNQNNAQRNRYTLPENNQLLHYLFFNAVNAETLGVWKPIGEEVIADLNRRHRNMTDAYNDSLMDYSERGQWKCPIFVGIRFFDIMISEAIAQNICWHMWLYYFPYFVDGICRNYLPEKQRVDLDSEFPTVYSFLLYEIISTIRTWISTIRELPLDQSNIVLESEALIHENGNIIKSSILVLGMCLKKILITNNIPTQLKSYLASIGLDLFFELAIIPDLARYASTLRASLLFGGSEHRDAENINYTGHLIRAVICNDNIPHNNKDVTALLNDLFHQFVKHEELKNIARYVELIELNGNTVKVSKCEGMRIYTISI